MHTDEVKRILFLTCQNTNSKAQTSNEKRTKIISVGFQNDGRKWETTHHTP